MRSLFAKGKLVHCYCTETRPYNQGSRLTAYELVYEKIPSTLVCDSMAAILMKEKGVSAVAVGADRVVANGDTANKIGTYQLAIVAKHHGVPFYVVAPSTSVDLTLDNGSQIKIEQRPTKEMTTINGMEIAAKGHRSFLPLKMSSIIFPYSSRGADEILFGCFFFFSPHNSLFLRRSTYKYTHTYVHHTL